MARRALKLKEIADLVGGKLSGNGDIRIGGVAGIREAREGQITFLTNPGYEKYLSTTRASAIIAPHGLESPIPVIRTANPNLALSKILSALHEGSGPSDPSGIHRSAVIDADAEIGADVGIGPHCQVSRGARIGRGTKIFMGCYIGEDVLIGEDCVIYPNVTVREACEIGARVVLHPGAVIGADGFGFAKDGETYQKVPQIGRVVIEDDVEIGANSTIDRATVGVTRIGHGTKIDNLVMIGHNVVVGDHSVMAGQVGISGSAELGKGVVLGGQVGIVGHIQMGDGVTVGAKGGVTKSLEANETYLGFPARRHRTWRRLQACIAQLPGMRKRLKDLAKRVEELEK